MRAKDWLSCLLMLLMIPVFWGLGYLVHRIGFNGSGSDFMTLCSYVLKGLCVAIPFALVGRAANSFKTPFMKRWGAVIFFAVPLFVILTLKLLGGFSLSASGTLGFLAVGMSEFFSEGFVVSVLTMVWFAIPRGKRA